MGNDDAGRAQALRRTGVAASTRTGGRDRRAGPRTKKGEELADDWRSYDRIAGRYDPVAAARFATVAERMWALLPSSAGARTLDVGTGTGIVPRSGAQRGASRLDVGCDRSSAMVARAREEAPWLCVVVADALALPFAAGSFDIATASFVLSHLREPDQALAEVHRVLKASGVVAVSSWAEGGDPLSSAWRAHLERALTSAAVERATAEVIPSESRFAQPGALESALTAAGFSVSAAQTVELVLTPTVAQFVEDRDLTAPGRLGRALLGDEAWERFTDGVRADLESRFGTALRHSRRAYVAVARRRVS